MELLAEALFASSNSVHDLEAALHAADKDVDNEIIQVLSTMTAGRLLIKEARRVLEKRKESFGISEKLVELTKKVDVMMPGLETNPIQGIRKLAGYATGAIHFVSTMIARSSNFIF